MSAHLVDLELDALISGTVVQEASTRHLKRCAQCQQRLSQMAASEVELLLVAAAELVVAPVEHSQVRCIASTVLSSSSELFPRAVSPRAVSPRAGSTPALKRYRSQPRLERTQQMLSSCAMVFALCILGWMSQPTQRTPLRSADAMWITAGCHASQPWCRVTPAQ